MEMHLMKNQLRNLLKQNQKQRAHLELVGLNYLNYSNVDDDDVVVELKENLFEKLSNLDVALHLPKHLEEFRLIFFSFFV